MGSLLDLLSPHVRIVTAVCPVAIAIFLRVVTGKSRVSTIAVPAGIAWVAVCVLMTPYSAGMQRDLEVVRALFR